MQAGITSNRTLEKPNPRPLILALEQRILFDGAAAADAVAASEPQALDSGTDTGLNQQTTSVLDALAAAPAPAPSNGDPAASDSSSSQQLVFTDTSLSDASSSLQPSSGGLFSFSSDQPAASVMIEAKSQAETAISQFLQQASSSQLFELFNGDRAEPDADWLARLDQLLTAIGDGNFNINIAEMDGASQFTAIAAYTREGPNGEPTVFINRFWFDMFDAPDATRALVEEFGHAIDDYLNPSADTAGDEGERFAGSVLHISEDAATSSSITNENDHGTVSVNGVSYDVEFATFNFVNAYSMVYDLNNNTNSLGLVTGAIDTNERWADKEQNSHFFNTASLGPVTIDDNNYNSAYFSGNDVSAIGINIGGVDYYGWVSRPIKSGGIVRGFYFWTDNDFNNNGSAAANLAAAQSDGNTDGDRSVLDNKGFLLVVDQAWFDQQIQTKTQYTLNNAKDGNLGTIWVSNIGSSSDRVDSSLNSLIVPNSAPVAANDSLTVNEDSGTTSVSAANGLLKNDTDANNDPLAITAFSVGGASTTVDPTTGGTYSITNVGSITVYKDGSYSFTPVSNYYGSVPPITYTVSDGTGTATAVLSISVAPVNDAPTATNDSITTSANTPKLLTLNDLGTYNDPENDPLAKVQITQLATNGILQFWNGSTWTSVTLNQEITVTQILQGLLRFAPDTGESGNNYATLQFKVSDGQAYSTAAYTLTVNVTAGNQAPIASADTNNVAEEGCNVAAAPATGNVITDGTADNDPENTTLTVTNITAYGNTQTINSSTTSANGTAIAGLYGTLTIGSDGSYSYVLKNELSVIDAMNSGDTKTETFTYTITDGTNTSSTTLTLTINGSNDAPVAADDFSTLIKGTNAGAGNYGTVTGNALANDTDVDNVNGDLTVKIVGGTTPPGASDLILNASSPISSVTLVITQLSGSWTAIVPTSPDQPVWLNAGYTTPALDRTGSQLTVHRSGSGGSATLVFSDNVALYNYENTSLYIKDPGNSNYTIVSVDITGATTTSSATISTTSDVSNISAGFTVTGAGVPDGTTVVSVNSTNKTITLSQSVNISNASLTFHDPNALSIDPSTQVYFQGTYGYLILNQNGSYTYTLTTNLTANQVVTEEFTYTVKDPANCTDTAVITIRASGLNAPDLANDTLVVSEDTGAHVTFNGSASGADSVKTNDADGSGGTPITLGNVASFTVAGDAATYNAGQTATITGVGTLSIAADGTIAFDPVDDYLGPVPTVTYTRTGSDNQPYTASLTITIQSVDDASILAADTHTIDEDSTAAGNVLANDADNDSTLSVASYSWNNGSGTTSGTVGSATPIIFDSVTVGTLTLNANGSYNFVPTADWNGTVPQITYTTNTGSSSTLEITVSPVNDAPALDLDASGAGTGISTAYTNAGSAISIVDTDVSISDIDDTNIETAVIVLTNPQSGDVLNFDATTLQSTYGITATSSSSGGVITVSLSGSASLASYQTAIRSITFSSTGTSTSDRVISVKVNDGEADSNTAYTTISVNPDNRAIAVTGTVVNEASPYVMFEVSGAENQWISLELGETGSGTGHADMGTDFLPNLQYFDGTNWVDYNGGLIRIPDNAADNGKLLVRTGVLQDSLFETTSAGYETLKLTARNAYDTANTGTGADGTAQIRDDGQGSIFLGNNHGSNNALAPNDPGDTDPAGPDYPPYLDDDRPVSVDSIVVNEDSPWAMFTVTGYSGQILSLALHDGNATMGDGNPADGSEDYGTALQYWNGAAWTAYNGTSVTLTSGTLLVRTAIHQDSLFEGQHAFSLGVTKLSSGTTVYGTANIYDDGTGSKYEFDSDSDGTATITSGPGTGFDDDRTLTVSSLTVNEASDYAIFTLTGNSGQTVSLALIDESSNGTVAGKANIDENQTLQIWDGLNWVDYNPANLPTFDANGKIFVRVDIQAEQDTPYEGSETFKLNATLTGRNTPVTGTATIKDDGTGVKFDGTFTSGSPTTDTASLDDDRVAALTVDSIVVNEGSPYAVFTVSGSASQLVTLALAAGATNPATGDGTDYGLADAGSDLQYWNGTQWDNYTAGAQVALNANGSLLVRVAITNDSIFDNGETFKLNATDANSTTVSGTATIKDDGTGTLFTNGAPSGDTPSTDGYGPFNDDRGITVSGLNNISEGSNAIFTVTLPDGNVNGNEIGLTLSNGTATSDDYSSNFTAYYYVGATKVDLAIVAGKISLPAGVTAFYVSVPTIQDSAFEGPENFSLTAAITGGKSAAGTSTVVDDGSGKVYDAKGQNGTGPGDDDRPSVPPSDPIPAPNASQIVEFNTPQPALAAEQPANANANSNTDSDNGQSGNALQPDQPGWQYGLVDWSGIRLSGDRDHFHQVWGEPRMEILEAKLDLTVEQGRYFAMPPEALLALDTNGSMRFDAYMKDGEELPPWIHLNRDDGSLRVDENAPVGDENVVVKVVATDSKGNQVTVTVILKPKHGQSERPHAKNPRDIGHLSGRTGVAPGKTAFSEQLRSGGSRGLQQDASAFLNRVSKLFNGQTQA